MPSLQGDLEQGPDGEARGEDTQAGEHDVAANLGRRLAEPVFVGRLAGERDATRLFSWNGHDFLLGLVVVGEQNRPQYNTGCK